jgi:hypothetical protein
MKIKADDLTFKELPILSARQDEVSARPALKSVHDAIEGLNKQMRKSCDEAARSRRLPEEELKSAAEIIRSSRREVVNEATAMLADLKLFRDFFSDEKFERQVGALRKKLGTASNAAVIVIAADRLAQSP